MSSSSSASDGQRGFGRSSTLPSRHGSAASTSSQDNEAVLGTFAEAKGEIAGIFLDLSECLNDTVTLLERSHMWVGQRNAEAPVVNEFRWQDMDQMQSVAARCRENAKVVQRDKMKVVFVGITSHGKSTSINALLHSKVLPTGIGKTTSCFVRLSASDSGNGKPYMILPGSTEHKDASQLKNVANLLDKGALKAKNIVDLRWPEEQCHLLRHDVVIFDTPGLDSDEDIDEFICQTCADADVFVLISNGVGTLSGRERQFFEVVQRQIGRPNLFILLNKWDMADDDDDDSPPQLVKEQHLDVCRELLCHKLGTVEPAKLETRVFFVSSKEALRRRVDPSHAHDTPPSFDSGKNTQDTRYASFMRFEQEFMQCISHSAIVTRFRNRAEEGLEAASFVANTLRKVVDEFKAHYEQTDAYISLEEQNLRTLTSDHSKLEARCQEAIDATPERVQSIIRRTIAEVVERDIEEILQRFPLPFRRGEVATYKHRLVEHVDERLQSRMTAALFEQASRVANDAREEMYRRAEAFLPGHFSLRSRAPYVGDFRFNLALDCSTLDNFKEDIRFHFSFGWSKVAALMPPGMRRAAESLAKRAYKSVWPTIQGSVEGHVHMLSSYFAEDETGKPDEIVVEETASSTNDYATDERAAVSAGDDVHALGSLKDAFVVASDVLTLSPIWATMAVSYYLMPRQTSRVLFKWLPAAGIGLGMWYGIEWALYTDSRREKVFRKQFMAHAQHELSRMAAQAAKSAAKSCEDTLWRNKAELMAHLDVIRAELERNVADAKEMRAVLGNRRDIASSLKDQSNQLQLKISSFVRKHFQGTSPTSSIKEAL